MPPQGNYNNNSPAAQAADSPIPSTPGPGGINITVKNNSPINHTSENLMGEALQALLAGQTESAIALYQQVLAKEPNHQNAMFGLATTYQRNMQVQQARKLYTKLLTKYPENREALNNFLALAAEEAPQDALGEFKRLESANPNFSPITAQIAMIYSKMGDNDKALQYLNRAVELSPENITYRYNLAVLVDKMGGYTKATALYRQVLAAAEDGVTLPVPVRSIQERLEYISTKN